MVSLSGAVFEDCVVKRGPRVREQGVFMMRPKIAALGIFPEVYALLDDGYVMEKLDSSLETIEDRTIDAVLDLAEALHATNESDWFWRCEPFLDYLRPRWADAQLGTLGWGIYSKRTRELSEAIRAVEGTAHGDLTLDNVMWKNGSLRLIDPIPPHAGCLPGALNDTGKLVLSMHWTKSPKLIPFVLDPLLHLSVISHAVRVLPYASNRNVEVAATCRREIDVSLQCL